MMKTPKKINFEDETSIIPEVVAESVFEELEHWLGAELPKPWIDELALRARTIYSHNPRFRARIRRSSGPFGCAGRDTLFAFMRHWLGALLMKQDYNLFRHLPVTYASGHELPLREPRTVRLQAFLATSHGIQRLDYR